MSQTTPTITWISERPILSRLCVLIAFVIALVAAVWHVGPGFTWSWLFFLASFIL